jgi:exodeoxyribonuclease III
MQVLNWNIRWGGKGKETKIVCKLIEYGADLIILTEYKNNESGNIIKNGLKAIGYNFTITSSLDSNKNGVGVFSKTPINIKANNFTDKENISVFSWMGLTFIGVFCANDDLTRRFIEDIAIMEIGSHTVIIGDLNTGPRGSQPDRYDDLNKIVEKGFIDPWRLANKHACWSYQSERGKSQPDHILCSSELKDMNWLVKYDFTIIEEDISDHAIMAVDFEMPIQ